MGTETENKKGFVRISPELTVKASEVFYRLVSALSLRRRQWLKRRSSKREEDILPAPSVDAIPTVVSGVVLVTQTAPVVNQGNVEIHYGTTSPLSTLRTTEIHLNPTYKNPEP